MAWIESHQDLAHHPKVARLAGMLEVSVPAAIGHLHCLWWWCLSYADDGNLTDFSDFEIGYAAQWQGEPEVFVEALQKAGWLDGREVHDWHEYGGKLAERRRQDAERKRKARAKTSAGRPPDSPKDDPADGVRREQNTTEDNTTEETAPLPAQTIPDDSSTLHDLKAVLVELFGEPPPKNWSLYNRIATWIRDQGGTVGEVRLKAGLIFEEWGRKACTATSVEKYWTRYDAAVGQLSDEDVKRYQAEVRRTRRRKEIHGT